MKRKVLFMIDSLGCGGAEKSLLSLLHHLDYARLDVSLSVVSQGGALDGYLPKEVKLLPFPKLGRIRTFLINFLYYISIRLFSHEGHRHHGAEIRWLCSRRIIPRYDGEFDVAVAYQQGFPTYYVSEKVTSRVKVAWVNTDLSKAGYRSRFNRPFYNKMSQVCVVSDALYHILPKDGFVSQNRLCVVKDILDAGLIHDLALSSDSVERLWGDSHGIRILTVGRLAIPKNYPLAVETAKILKNKGLSFTWIFVGEGSERRIIESLIRKYRLEDDIHLAGFQINPYPYFVGCDIYVQTSSFEGFGLTISEAKIFNKPIVTTCFPSAYDQIKDGENGLIASMDAESVSDKILAIVNNPSLKDKLVTALKQECNLTAVTESEKVNQMLSEG